MTSKRARLDRFISKQANIPQREVQRLLAQGKVQLNHEVTRDGKQVINPFTHVMLADQILQDNTAYYLMLHKPPGTVSATKDATHPTVVELLPDDIYPDIHIAGRLDFNSSGLLLLTNDGQWSRFLASPESGIQKRYRVTVEKPLSQDHVSAFAEGMYFDYEGITTRPATLKIISPFEAEVLLREGRYHQIKRMFGRFQNRVVSLHRSGIGSLELDENLAPGESRPLSEQEVRQLEGD